MKKGTVLVDQVLPDGKIVQGYDESLSPSEIFETLRTTFPAIKTEYVGNRIITGEYNGVKYAIRCKNITYLGNPHPAYKKRIQIANDLNSFYKDALKIGAKPLLIGIYCHQNNLIFSDFSISTYLSRKAHNSSAHVYSSDIAVATEDGYFQKVDYFGNRITLFRSDAINIFLDEVLGIENISRNSSLMMPFQEYSEGYFDSVVEDKNLENFIDEVGHSVAGLNKSYDSLLEEIISLVRHFFTTVHKKWHGIACYEEMISNDYRNKFQPEWAGFYLEYEFEKYLKNNGLKDKIIYSQNKKKDGIDLDLFFPSVDSFGDLKAHSEGSNGIQGNDWKTIMSIIDKKSQNNHVYYIVCEHETEKDIDYNYEVTKFWNSIQKKADLMSYHKKMKNNVTLKKAYILAIGSDNRQYLTKFIQGINSNGKPREPKIMIEKKNLNHFVIAETIL